MKISEKWLREWVNPSLTREQLAERLTLSGLEVEEIISEQDDAIFNVAITPNRGDCLSAKGLALEIAALTESQFQQLEIPPVPAQLSDKISVTTIQECPHYVGRIIRRVKTDTQTPAWLQERLQKSGLSCISPIVDVMNYVMLEIGQPMHAFDFSKIKGNIAVRFAKNNEELVLLDGQKAKLNPATLVIADDHQPLAIAGLMGGADSGVTLLTENIFLESAFFLPDMVAKARQIYNISSESAYRFERGVDPELQLQAIERATQLILNICGGEPGPLIEATTKEFQPTVILLREDRINKILGINIPNNEIEKFVKRINCNIHKVNEGWQVKAPLRRFDLKIEEDLIEEIARLYGYEKIPSHHASMTLETNCKSEPKLSLITLRNIFRDKGYDEIITYSFVNQTLQNLVDPESETKPLLNPMSDEMSVMRTSLWPGLLQTLTYNLNRQQTRARLFEIGLRFKKEKEWEQQRVVSGLLYGNAFPEQWGIQTQEADFFNLKGDLENLFQLTHAKNEFLFKPGKHPALHPGQTANIFRNDQYLGTMGTLHPATKQKLDIPGKVVLFEILLDRLEKAGVPRSLEISKFPEIRRDIAIIIPQQVLSIAIKEEISKTAGQLLKDLTIFDVYQGKGIPLDHKSIALALTLQHSSRTLKDEEVADLMEKVISVLKDKFAAQLRG